MWIGLKSPDSPAKLTMSVSVTVRPSDSHSWPTCTSSKYRCAAVNDMASPQRTTSPTMSAAIGGASFAWHPQESLRSSWGLLGQQRSRRTIRRVDADVDDFRFRHLQHL